MENNEVDNIMHLKDWLTIVIMPLLLGLFATFFPAIQNWYRRRTFTKLILRELSEVSPYLPKDNEKDDYKHWWQHSKKTFIHQKIFQQPNENRDFILALDPNLVYFVSQYWNSFNERNPTQYINYLTKLSDFSNDYKPILGNRKDYQKYRQRITENKEKWLNILKKYNVISDVDYQKYKQDKYKF